jgi:DNA ligase-associated metallophosphoesterase
LNPPHPNQPDAPVSAQSLEIEWAGETLRLFADRAAYWPRRGTLIIADTHFGKDATFRRAGVALPHGTTGADLNRLSALLDETSAGRLLILGDFFHAVRGRSDDTLAAIAAWRDRRRGLRILNVRGNHDIKAGDPPREWDIDIVDEPWLEPPFAWQHHPANLDDAFSVGGHIHPAVAMDGIGGRIKAPCFWFRRRSAVLPAFSEFTGVEIVRPREGDILVAVGYGEIARVL